MHWSWILRRSFVTLPVSRDILIISIAFWRLNFASIYLFLNGTSSRSLSNFVGVNSGTIKSSSFVFIRSLYCSSFTVVWNANVGVKSLCVLTVASSSMSWGWFESWADGCTSSIIKWFGDYKRLLWDMGRSGSFSILKTFIERPGVGESMALAIMLAPILP